MSKKSKLIVAALIERKSMNDPRKFGTEFGSDNAPEHSAARTQVNGRYAIMENIAALCERRCISVQRCARA
jgi:hypothetical protein